MCIINWFRNGSLDAFHQFCNENNGKLISAELRDSTELIRGILYNYILWSIEADGIFLLLTNHARHPAFYSIDDIESLHYLAPARMIQHGPPILLGMSEACA